MSCYIDTPIKSTDFSDFGSLFNHIIKRFEEVFELVYQTHYKKNDW